MRRGGRVQETPIKMAKADIIVNNHRYSVACADGQEARLQVLAGELDQRVRRIALAVGDIGEARLLLIAGLALLDELSDAQAGAVPTAFMSKAAAALSEAAARIESIAARVEAGQEQG